jgi:pimeloyl-ACP methyl ester carboxylesterase/tetratricopeptide (TPR) repeat protein
MFALRAFAALTVTTASLAAPPPTSADSAAPAADVRSARVRLSTGVTLEVTERGAPDGEPVLFLHGYTDSWFSFSTVLDRLPPTIRAIVPTQRGHGDSERPECCYRPADFAADAVALLDALRVSRATVVGHSMGSFVAQRLAIVAPSRVSRLVLVGSGATARTAPVLDFNQTVGKLTDPISRAFVRDFQYGAIAMPVPGAFMDRVVSESEKLPARVWRDALGALVAPDAVIPIDRIATDTLIVWGDKDALFSREDQAGLLKAIRGSRLVTYTGVGHSPNWEDPDRFTADLVAFLGASRAKPAAQRAGHGAHSAAPQAGAKPENVKPDQHQGHGSHTTSAGGVMPILQGLGDWHHRITTKSPEAQRYFDQGLRLTYGFNHEEAVRSFERAVQLDPSCAMCHWGVAYALGPNINLPMEAKIEPRALEAGRQAVRLKGTVTAGERALIEAMAVRYGEPAGASRAERDAAYADAMRSVAKQFPADADAQVLFADAMMNLRPWNQWTREGQPQPGTLELVGVLSQTITRQPSHAGACHFFIHAVEASLTPERALPCAERLPRLMPGAGHVVHMPAHIYLRVGRYEDAARANIAAVEADNRYFASRTAPGIYPMFYAPHNLHFLWATYLLSGQREKALGAARALQERVDMNDVKATPSLEAFLTPAFLTLARFGNWDAVLAAPAPPADLHYATGMWHYARGLAYAARKDIRAAEGELAKVRAESSSVKDDVIIILNPAPAVLKLAAEVLAGDIAAKQQRFDAAVAHLKTAITMEDALTYDEPPPWYHSVRNRLGATLLEAGRPADAAAAFRDDLRYVRETGWSLSGLERALRAAGRTADAADAGRRFKEAWKYADVSPETRQ